MKFLEEQYNMQNLAIGICFGKSVTNSIYVGVNDTPMDVRVEFSKVFGYSEDYFDDILIISALGKLGPEVEHHWSC